MATATKNFLVPFKMVVALDVSEYAEMVLEHALDQAARHDAPELHFVVVAERGRDTDARVEQLRTWLTAIVLDGLSTFQRGRGDWNTRVHIRCGRPEEEIVALGAEVQADLLVIGRASHHRWRKSVTERIVETAPCPTLVVGLTEHVVERIPQCPACVEVRAASEGERWFCDAHTDHDRARWSGRLIGEGGGPSLQGGPML